MSWCFAIVNNKLAEIYFDRKKDGRLKITNHCYIEKREFKAQQEQKWIREDTKRVRVTYRKGQYKLVE